MKLDLKRRRHAPAASFLVMACLIAGCRAETPLPRVASLDLPRYMGDWYVIAAIPSFLERNAYDAVESYSLRPDGRVRTQFRYRDGSFGAPVKTLRPLGTVRPGSGDAVWGMQFIWPIEAEYVIAYIDADYRTVIVGRSKRDYVWIMARVPVLPAEQYGSLVGKVAALGYDVRKLRKVPQRWPE